MPWVCSDVAELISSALAAEDGRIIRPGHSRELDLLIARLSGRWRRPTSQEILRLGELYRATCTDLMLAEEHDLPRETVANLHALVRRTGPGHRPRAAVDEGARVGRVLEDAEDGRDGRRPPDQVAGAVRAGQEEVAVVEEAHHLTGRLDLQEAGEDQFEPVLNLLVGVLEHAPQRVQFSGQIGAERKRGGANPPIHVGEQAAGRKLAANELRPFDGGFGRNGDLCGVHRDDPCKRANGPVILPRVQKMNWPISVACWRVFHRPAMKQADP